MERLFTLPEMIKAVRLYLSDKGFELQPKWDHTLEPARVPVFAVKRSPEKKRFEAEVFVDIITESAIEVDAYFKDRKFGSSLQEGLRIQAAASATFYRHYFPSAHVFWAVPAYSQKSSGYQGFLDKCKDEKIGVLVVDRTEANTYPVTEAIQPLSLVDERLAELSVYLSRSRSEPRDDALHDILKEWSRKDVSYLVFYCYPEYRAADISARDEKSNVSRVLVNSMRDLNSLSYSEVLVEFGDSYNRKYKSDYEIAQAVTRELWERFGLKYPDLHQEFEPVLKLNPRYRDHFLHAFQVFLFGAFVINALYDQAPKCGFECKEGHRIEDCWLLASTYHDFNYTVQNFEDWTQRFFKKALHLEDEGSEVVRLFLEGPYIKNGYMLKTKSLTDSLDLPVDDAVLRFLYQRIMVSKNHGLISGLSLLKYIEGKRNSFSHFAVRCACKAIAIHDPQIYLYLRGNSDVITTKKDKKTKAMEKNFLKKRVLPTLNFSQDPISFLLILSDTLQEQGREKGDNPLAVLESLHKDGSKIAAEISFSGAGADRAFQKKINEVNSNLVGFLNAGEMFRIRITNRENNQHHEFLV